MTPPCRFCGKQLRPDPYREGGRGYDGNGFFCTLRCGFYYAVRLVKQQEGS